MTTTPDPANPTAEALAEAAWWHLLNRHDLAQALDELGAVPTQREHLLAAIEQLTTPCTRSARSTATGGHQ